MTLAYLASFDVADRRSGFGNVTLSRSGAADINVPVDALVEPNPGGISVFNHYPMTLMGMQDREGGSTQHGDLNPVSSADFGGVFTVAAYLAASSEGWADPAVQVALNLSTLRYTFSYPGHAFTGITFETAQTRALFGFASDFSGSSASVAGTRTPSFIIQPVLTAVTTYDAEGVNYEPTGISSVSVSDFGIPFGVTRKYAPLYRDWTQQAEPRAKVFRQAASATHPFTHQALFQISRSTYPFVLSGNAFGDGKDYAMRLRADACAWDMSACKRKGGAMDNALFDVMYRAQVLGAYTP